MEQKTAMPRQIQKPNKKLDFSITVVSKQQFDKLHCIIFPDITRFNPTLPYARFKVA